MNRQQPRTVFYSISAQSGNLGDLEIRRTVLDWVREANLPVNVFVGTMPESYKDGFDLRDSDKLYASSIRFQLALVRGVLNRRANLVFAPGPQTFGDASEITSRALYRHVTTTGKQLINLVNTVAVRISGGSSLTVARAVRGTSTIGLFLERLKAKHSAVYCVRDTASETYLDRSVTIVPDVGFQGGSGADSDQPKTLVVFSFRGDQFVSSKAVRDAALLARRHGFTPVLVTQVKSDEEAHRRLSSETGMNHVEWGNRTHSEQLRHVLDTYSQASAVISNRLHSLIFGSRCGAFPIAVVYPGIDKLNSTLAHVVPMLQVRSDDDDWTEVLSEHFSGKLDSDVANAVTIAKRSLVELRTEIVELLQK